jgi:hypothetical protein
VDDALISFRYARHLAEGHGLVWNVGEWVEGYTNFAWTLWMSLAFLVDLDPVHFAQLSGLAAFALALVATGAATRALLGADVPALVAVTLLALTPTFNAYATSGLETALQAATLTGALALTLRAWRRQRLELREAAALSSLLALAVWTRMDSAALGAWFGLAALAGVLRGGWAAPDRRLRTLAALVLPFTVLVGGWLSWKAWAYGGILPNTFYAKTGAEGAWSVGLAYLGTYVHSTLLYPALIVGALGVAQAWRSRHAPVLVGLGALGTWLLYVAAVGGDFMEFRFLVAALPLATVIGVWALYSAIHSPVLRAVIVATTLAGGLHHQLTFEGQGGIESVEQLASHLTHEVQDWEGVGKTLGRDLGPDSSAVLATTAAGAIPYYARLRTVDMLGLTDEWVARNGKRVSLQIAHHRLAPLHYLVEREVNLVLGQPWLRRAGKPPRTRYPFAHLRELHALVGERARDFPPSASMVEIPMAGDRVLVALYLLPHPDVDRAIAERGWRRIPIVTTDPDTTL